MELVQTADPAAHPHADPAITEMYNKGKVQSERIVTVAQAFTTEHIAAAFGNVSELKRKRFIEVCFPQCYPPPDACHAVLPTRSPDGKPSNHEIGAKIGKDENGIVFDYVAQLCEAFGN